MAPGVRSALSFLRSSKKKNKGAEPSASSSPSPAAPNAEARPGEDGRADRVPSSPNGAAEAQLRQPVRSNGEESPFTHEEYQTERRKTFDLAAEYPERLSESYVAMSPQELREREATAEAARWIAELTGLSQPDQPHSAPDDAMSGDPEALQAWLESGEVLCALAHKLGPVEAKAVNAPNIMDHSSSRRASSTDSLVSRASSAESLASEKSYSVAQRNAKRMEVVGRYLDAIRQIGVPEHDLFNSVDLVNGKDMRAVVRSLHSLGRVAQRIEGFEGPHLGAKLAQRNNRTFSEAQLAEARAMPTKLIRDAAAAGAVSKGMKESPSTSASRQRAMQSWTTHTPSPGSSAARSSAVVGSSPSSVEEAGTSPSTKGGKRRAAPSASPLVPSSPASVDEASSPLAAPATPAAAASAVAAGAAPPAAGSGARPHALYVRSLSDGAQPVRMLPSAAESAGVASDPASAGAASAPNSPELGLAAAARATRFQTDGAARREEAAALMQSAVALNPVTAPTLAAEASRSCQRLLASELTHVVGLRNGGSSPEQAAPPTAGGRGGAATSGDATTRPSSYGGGAREGPSAGDAGTSSVGAAPAAGSAGDAEEALERERLRAEEMEMERAALEVERAAEQTRLLQQRVQQAEEAVAHAAFEALRLRQEAEVLTRAELHSPQANHADDSAAKGGAPSEGGAAAPPAAVSPAAAPAAALPSAPEVGAAEGRMAPPAGAEDVHHDEVRDDASEGSLALSAGSGTASPRPNSPAVAAAALQDSAMTDAAVVAWGDGMAAEEAADGASGADEAAVTMAASAIANALRAADSQSDDAPLSDMATAGGGRVAQGYPPDEMGDPEARQALGWRPGASPFAPPASSPSLLPAFPSPPGTAVSCRDSSPSNTGGAAAAGVVAMDAARSPSAAPSTASSAVPLSPSASASSPRPAGCSLSFPMPPPRRLKSFETKAATANPESPPLPPPRQSVPAASPVELELREQLKASEAQLAEAHAKLRMREGVIEELEGELLRSALEMKDVIRRRLECPDQLSPSAIRRTYAVLPIRGDRARLS